MMTGSEELMGMEHRVSRRLAHMPPKVRAAQFSPFAALTGYDRCIEETQRLTDARPVLCEDAAAEIDRMLGMMMEGEFEGEKLRIDYFVPDKTKAGGSFGFFTGTLRVIDANSGQLVFHGGKRINISDLLSITIA